MLTVPITLTSPADLRVYSLPVGLAGLLVVAALYVLRGEYGGGGSDWSDRDARSIRIDRWFGWCAAAVLVIAIASAFFNGTWDLSRGWIFQLVVGLGWAVLIGRLATTAMVGRILVGGFVVALLAIALSFLHRYETGLRDVRWPIGPITVTAALGALWAAVAVGMLGSGSSSHPWRKPFSPVVFGLTAVTLLSAVALVYNSARRAGWLGLAASVAFVALTAGWRRFSSRAVRAGIVVAVLAAGGMAAWWVRIQAASPVPEVGGSIALRTELWKRTLELTSKKWWLGHGPDMFVCEMTTAMARAKAETPHLLHGDIAAAAHNEWLQAVFELGVFGGLAYLALPMLAVLGAVTTVFKAPRDTNAWPAVPVCAGLVAVVVVEMVSINLRNPIVPAWYWTFIGLALAVARGSRGVSRRISAWAPRIQVVRFVSFGLAAALLLAVYGDVQSGVAQSRARQWSGRDDRRAAELLELAVDRFGARHWIETRKELGLARTAVARSAGGADRASWADAALAAWEGLWKRSPGYPGVGVGLAEALMDSGRVEDARETLKRVLDDVDPYDAAANLAYSQFLKDDPVGCLQCAKRAARDGALIEEIVRLVNACLNFPQMETTWSAEVAAAELDVVAAPASDWRDPLAPEILRIEAARRDRRGDTAGAARLQLEAAQAYRRMYESNAPHRRPADAEWDAWYQAAEYTFRSDAGAYEKAYKQVCEAERFAVLGIDHAYLRDPDPKGEFVGGEVIPLELPARLRPLWRLSAKLHLAAGCDDYIDLRILSSLPPERWADGLAATRADLERELASDFASLPAKQRPARFRNAPGGSQD